MAITTRSRFWGPLFPDVWDQPGRTFWGPLFPDPGPALDLVQPIGPAGVATFVADLDATLNLVLEYQTDIFKAYDGTERRAAILDLPRRRISGSALLVGGASVRALRTKLARHAAASGATFLIGLPFEGLLLAADAAGKQLTVSATALANCDWANPGQRVVVMAPDRTTVNAVVQSASGSWINLDIAPGAIGKEGGIIMPTVPIFLEPQQSFDRFRNPEGFERWSINASAALFGFQKQPVAAMLDIEATYPAAGNLVGVIVQARTPGVAGNDIRIAFEDDSLAGVDVAEVGDEITVHFVPGVSTVADVTAAINASSSLVRCIGSWNASFVLDAGDAFSLSFLDGGADGDYALDGTGAVVTMHAGRPVFDRALHVEDTAADSIQAANEIVELGGVPANVGQAIAPDWGRRIAMHGKVAGGDWQWLKRFLATVRGRQRAFWLPTYRQDLKPAAGVIALNSLIIEGLNDEDGGFFTWYPARRDIEIRQADGTITRVTIANAIDNGDGTITLTIGLTLSGSPIERVSWLELCRLEEDAITVTFQGHRFAMQTLARAVMQ